MIDHESEYLRLYTNTLKNAGRRAIDFSLSKERFLLIADKQQGVCAVTGIDFDFSHAIGGYKRPFYPSIDRINSKVGYKEKNIRLVVTIANYAMNEWGDGPLFEMVESIVRLREVKEQRESKAKICNSENEIEEAIHESKRTSDRYFEYLDRSEAAEYLTGLGLRTAKGTLQKWVTTGGGPAYRRFGKRAVYTVSDLNAWAESKLTPLRYSSSAY